MITDNFGQCLASLLSNVASAPQLKPMRGRTLAATTQSAVGWGTISPRFGIWGLNGGSASGNPYVQLGSGLTPVARSDFVTETPLLGPEGSLVNVVLGSGYGSGIVSILQTVGAFTLPQTVREGTIFIGSNSQNASVFGAQEWALMRYNYTPLLVGLGQIVTMETSISV